jgi:hypothetical protein
MIGEFDPVEIGMVLVQAVGIVLKIMGNFLLSILGHCVN